MNGHLRNPRFVDTSIGLGEAAGLTLAMEDAPKLSALLLRTHARGVADAAPMMADAVKEAVLAERRACAEAVRSQSFFRHFDAGMAREQCYQAIVERGGL